MGLDRISSISSQPFSSIPVTKEGSTSSVRNADLKGKIEKSRHDPETRHQRSVLEKIAKFFEPIISSLRKAISKINIFATFRKKEISKIEPLNQAAHEFRVYFEKNPQLAILNDKRLEEYSSLYKNANGSPVKESERNKREMLLKLLIQNPSATLEDIRKNDPKLMMPLFFEVYRQLNLFGEISSQRNLFEKTARELWGQDDHVKIVDILQKFINELPPERKKDLECYLHVLQMAIRENDSPEGASKLDDLFVHTLQSHYTSPKFTVKFKEKAKHLVLELIKNGEYLA